MDRKTIRFFVVLIVAFSMIALIGCEEKGLEEKVIWNGSIDNVVDYETIIIEIDKKFHAKEFTANDFKKVDIVEESFSWLTKTQYDKHIENNSLPESFNHMIIFKIVDKGPKNLIKAIRKLEKVNFVKYAGPSQYFLFNQN